MSGEAPRTIERKLRTTAPGAELLSKIPAERLDDLLRETKDCSVRQKKRLMDERLKALGIKKLGHRLQIQAALRDTREHADQTSPQPPISSMTVDDFLFTPPNAAPMRVLADVTNSFGRGRFSAVAEARAALSAAKKSITHVRTAEPFAPAEDCDEPVLESNEPDEPVLEANEPSNASMCALLLAEAAAASPPPVARRWQADAPSTSPSFIARTTGFVASLPGRFMRLPFRAIGIYVNFWLLVAGATFTIALFVAERVASRLPIGRSQAIALIGLARELTKGAPEIIMGA